MIQGTTPYLLLQIDGYDLTNAANIVVSLKYLTGVIDLGQDRLRVVSDGLNSIVAVHLTQEETLRLGPTNAEIQVRWRDPDGEAHATAKQNIDIAGAIHKGVI